MVLVTFKNRIFGSFTFFLVLSSATARFTSFSGAASAFSRRTSSPCSFTRSLE
jgi:hypothetical protein